MPLNSTAILIFSYRPEKEASIKKVLSNHSARTNVAFFKALQNRVEEITEPVGLPRIICDDTVQRGIGFQERLFNAIEDGFAQGYEKLIVLGNDAPGMQTSDLTWAVDELEKGNSAVRLSQLGGASLIALSKSDFENFNWFDIKWNSKETGADLIDALDNCSFQDDLVHEINTWTDLILFELQNNYSRISVFISELLSQVKVSILQLFFIPRTEIPQLLQFRGPPRLV